VFERGRSPNGSSHFIALEMLLQDKVKHRPSLRLPFLLPREFSGLVLDQSDSNRAERSAENCLRVFATFRDMIDLSYRQSRHKYLLRSTSTVVNRSAVFPRETFVMRHEISESKRSRYDYTLVKKERKKSSSSEFLC